VTARTKVHLVLGAFVCLNLAVWGAKQILAGAFDPILKALGQ
jgi:hypothetical protein